MLQIPVIKEVITVPIAGDDEVLAKMFSKSVNNVGTIRREMKWFPKYRKGLLDGGSVVDIETFRDYLSYRRSHDWEIEMAKIKAAKKRSPQS
jgi:hypothetical protein